MGALVFAARVTVAIVLAYAAFAKMHEAGRLPGQMRAIGVPAPLSVAAAVVVPTVELVIALALASFVAAVRFKVGVVTVVACCAAIGLAASAF